MPTTRPSEPTPTPSLEATTLRLLNAFARIAESQEHTRIFEEMGGVSLPAADLRLLEYLNGRPPVATSTVAAALVTDLSRTSRQARRLEELGYVARVPDPADGRRTLLEVAPAAQPVMNASLLGWAEASISATADWSDDEVAALARLLRIVHTGLSGWLADRPDSAAPELWRRLVAEDGVARSEARLALGETAVRLFAWLPQARWFEQLLRDHAPDLSPQVYLTLVVVGRHGPLAVSDLAERTWVDHTQASKRVSRLQELGLVERAADTFDRRTTLVRCSRRGVAQVRRLGAAQRADLSAALGPLDPADRDRWAALAERYVAALTARGLISEL
ncbi:MarR family winged helix-turn-helix transcriptional regulator [Pimelobacter simplex]|uniref:MarR family winged helix-turn-helix transcriptional regulator n=1 Tax=Nocardioides simplex TaxID=2045 RepID=UPI00214FCE8B|nr:MarR family transcriptional regulator [Pimelobacter simplex]UUW91120.1 MarR family transcriptional regulator [Pimelobacter simplex]UUW94948.1 MarR family transcriptional regulator [Pimelobacter simplex]